MPFAKSSYVPAPVVEQMSGRFTDSREALHYILAGNAVFTLRSVSTQKRYTYRVQKVDDPKRPDTYFIKLLVGPDNNHSFAYMGMLYPKRKGIKVESTKKSLLSVSKSELMSLAPSFKALDFAVNWMLVHPTITPKIEVWHSGRCGRCGRTLTVPESVQAGIGPECAGKMGVGILGNAQFALPLAIDKTYSV